MWLSLVERCVRDAKAAGSNPVIPTKNKKSPKGGFLFFEKGGFEPAEQEKKPADFPKEAKADLLENATAAKRSEAGGRREPNVVIPTKNNKVGFADSISSVDFVDIPEIS